MRFVDHAGCAVKYGYDTNRYADIITDLLYTDQFLSIIPNVDEQPQDLPLRLIAQYRRLDSLHTILFHDQFARTHPHHPSSSEKVSAVDHKEVDDVKAYDTMFHDAFRLIEKASQVITHLVFDLTCFYSPTPVECEYSYDSSSYIIELMDFYSQQLKRRQDGVQFSLKDQKEAFQKYILDQIQHILDKVKQYNIESVRKEAEDQESSNGNYANAQEEKIACHQAGDRAVQDYVQTLDHSWFTSTSSHFIKQRNELCSDFILDNVLNAPLEFSFNLASSPSSASTSNSVSKFQSISLLPVYRYKRHQVCNLARTTKGLIMDDSIMFFPHLHTKTWWFVSINVMMTRLVREVLKHVCNHDWDTYP